MLIKICGITNAADARDAVAAGATALGFNFYEKSPRYIRPEALSEWIGEVPAQVLRVGVFVNMAADEVADVMARCRLEVAQLYGAAVGPAGVRTWLARNVDESFRVEDLTEDPEAWLLDSPGGALHGGTGETFDWNRARGIARRIVLAGGLDAGNVARAIEAVKPWGVDACSRLEASPGRKDKSKVNAFVAAAQEAAKRT
ncbi:MAG TPA: phosphoribosylanthranilate isomerase [Bryobacteraceae bacterium]|jgi:phosphoribosylanthranilate isomerase|nr:phosphoribosylanthranilate isomerase [Bryobacteraceae bacterium]